MSMHQEKPTLPKGMRDFGPAQMLQRNELFNVIKHDFQKYGFLPLETPALENLAVLQGKYGAEGDQLLFKVLNSGNFLSKIEKKDFEQNPTALLPKISEKGLRYDLTVPLARYVAMHQHELTFPFKRYQIQPVWRADRPQKGRYREFYQCDADILGTQSLICEAEIISMVYEVFQKLGIRNFSIFLNHRKLLKGLAAWMGEPDKEQALCMAIDKCDKIGKEKVMLELMHKNFSQAALQKLKGIFELQGTNEEKLGWVKQHCAHNEAGLTGLHELNKIRQYVQLLGVPGRYITFSPTLARGLAYYTGTIFEVVVHNVAIGSVGGGGRYDHLISIFGLPDMPGVGFSFGVERIYEVMKKLNLFSKKNKNVTQIMLTHIDAHTEIMALKMLTQLRSKDVKAEIYPTHEPLKKQLRYADKKNIPFVGIINAETHEKQAWVLRNMLTGEQTPYTGDQLVNFFNLTLPEVE